MYGYVSLQRFLRPSSGLKIITLNTQTCNGQKNPSPETWTSILVYLIVLPGTPKPSTRLKLLNLSDLGVNTKLSVVTLCPVLWPKTLSNLKICVTKNSLVVHDVPGDGNCRLPPTQTATAISM